MGKDFKNKNKYDGHSCPPIWRPKEIDWSSMTFEEKMQYYLKDSRDRIKDYVSKKEFVSSREEKIIEEKRRLKKESLERKLNRGA